MPKLLISIHIPKTAGTTLGSLLKQKYKDKMLFVYPALVNGFYCYGSTPQEAHDKIMSGRGESLALVMFYAFQHGIEAIHGHVPITEFEPFENKFDIQYITFLREPAVRAFSNYCHFRIFESKTLTDEELYYQGGNQIYKFTGGKLEKFWYIGSSETWEQDLVNLKLQGKSIPLNVTPRHSLKPNYDLITKYNQLDMDIWTRYVISYRSQPNYGEKK